MAIWQRFRTDQRGTTAVIFSLALVPLVGFAGAAIDYNRAIGARTALQKAADSTSLAMVSAAMQGRTLNHTQVFNGVLPDGARTEDLRVEGQWIVPGRQFRVTATAHVRMTVFSVLQDQVAIGVQATALANQDMTEAEIDGVNLAPEAADYNEMSAYCYNPVTGQRLGVLDPADPTRRIGFLKIADNTDEGVARPPENLKVKCASNENPSYHLKNVRNARTSPHLRNTGEVWNHYTDTTISESGLNRGAPVQNTQYRDLIETIACDTKEQCRMRQDGGILPNNNQTGRTPAQMSSVCRPGSYVYYGWEDRPPNIGQWTDKDYDDIRLVTKCPQQIPGAITVRLVQ